MENHQTCVKWRISVYGESPDNDFTRDSPLIPRIVMVCFLSVGKFLFYYNRQINCFSSGEDNHGDLDTQKTTNISQLLKYLINQNGICAVN